MYDLFYLQNESIKTPGQEKKRQSDVVKPSMQQCCVKLNKLSFQTLTIIQPFIIHVRFIIIRFNLIYYY